MQEIEKIVNHYHNGSVRLASHKNTTVRNLSILKFLITK